ncbi:MAG TPA: hypothetical protein PLS10_08540 [Chitinophagales bacterium]|nr:hypothetical protein [Chitinophagales bacterium]
MKNKAKKPLVPSSKTLINIIVSSDDIKNTAEKLNVEPKKIYNVLSGNNKRDEAVVLKVMKRCISSRLKKEQKILDKVKL